MPGPEAPLVGLECSFEADLDRSASGFVAWLAAD
jgi:hypothetical protein